MITRDELKRTTIRFTLHADLRDSFQNHYTNDAFPRLTCIVTSPRNARSKVVFSKRFYVDGVEVFGCRELLDRLNAPRPASAPAEVAAA
jgi:hypothetical protein